mmetsp:Transcript_54352/g.118895  ORF Transcript_54352/g.118895 Transcript_54352/m.118895 type:complete len:224 (-) Transcript_54352:76-747(-)
MRRVGSMQSSLSRIPVGGRTPRLTTTAGVGCGGVTATPSSARIWRTRRMGNTPIARPERHHHRPLTSSERGWGWTLGRLPEKRREGNPQESFSAPPAPGHLMSKFRQSSCGSSRRLWRQPPWDATAREAQKIIGAWWITTGSSADLRRSISARLERPSPSPAQAAAELFDRSGTPRSFLPHLCSRASAAEALLGRSGAHARAPSIPPRLVGSRRATARSSESE